MKKLLLILLSLISILDGQLLPAQDSSYLFNKTFELEGGSFISPLIDTIDNGYLIVISEYSADINRSIKLQKLNQEGIIEWSSQLDSMDYYLGLNQNDLIRTQDGNYLIFYGKPVTSFDADIRLVKFTPLGEVLWKKTIGDANKEFMYHMMETEDKGFLLVGAYQEPDSIGAAYVMKTDSLGGIEWTNNYVLPGGNISASTVVEVDSGYVIGARAKLNGIDNDMFWFKIDYGGELIWEKSFENPNANDCSASIYAKADGTYLLTGCMNQYLWRGPFVAELDENFDMTWHKFHDTEEHKHQLFGKPVIREDGSFLSLSLYTNILEGDMQQPQIISFDAEGEIKWKKDITINPDLSVFINSVKPTSDGGYIFAGGQILGQQKGWVLKTDSLGNTCSFIGCDSLVVTSPEMNDTVGAFTPTLQAFNYGIVVGPNPAKERLLVKHEISNWMSEIRLVLRDVHGRVVKSQAINEPHLFHALSLGELSSGVYLYSVESEDGMIYQRGKIIVE